MKLKMARLPRGRDYTLLDLHLLLVVQAGILLLLNRGVTKKKKKVTWQCDRGDLGCKMQVQTQIVNDALLVVKGGEPHPLHLPDPDRVKRAKLATEVKTKAAVQNHSTSKQVVADSLGQGSVDDAAQLPSNNSLQQMVWRSRRGERNKRIKTGEAIGNYDSLTSLVLPLQLSTYNNEPFLAYDSGPATGDDRILLFATEDTLEILSKSPLWLADGCFKTAPVLFKQIYTLHAFEQGHTLPSLFGMLPNKCAATYKRFWAAVKGLLGDEVQPTILLDFEQAYLRKKRGVCSYRNL